MEHSACSRKRARIGWHWRSRIANHFAFCMFLPTRSTDRWVATIHLSARGRATPRIVRIRLRKRQAITWCGPIFTLMKDRHGHDHRYAMDTRKIEHELGWKPRETFESGIRKTITWYLQNEAWVNEVTAGNYRQWIATHYS